MEYFASRELDERNFINRTIGIIAANVPPTT